MKPTPLGNQIGDGVLVENKMGNESVQSNGFCRVPVSVSSRLPGGDVHRLEANGEIIRIVTWKGVYGNQDSKTVFEISLSDVVNVECLFRIWFPASTCYVRYRDVEGKERLLKFRVFDQESHSGRLDGQRRENEYTEAVAEALKELRQGKKAVFPEVIFDPLGSMIKLLFGGAMIGLMALLVALGSEDGLAELGPVLRLMGVLMFPASLAALGIDHVRIRTGWHSAIKIGTYIVLIVLAFVLSVVLIFLLFEVFV